MVCGCGQLDGPMQQFLCVAYQPSPCSVSSDRVMCYSILGKCASAFCDATCEFLKEVRFACLLVQNSVVRQQVCGIDGEGSRFPYLSSFVCARLKKRTFLRKRGHLVPLVSFMLVHLPTQTSLLQIQRLVCCPLPRELSTLFLLKQALLGCILLCVG